MERPIEPGPTRTEAEQSAYAQDMAKYTTWLAENLPAEPVTVQEDGEHA